jgi:rRNA-processing protein EBP2
MPNKSKLKMALAAEKGTDFNKLKLHKKEKLANKKKAVKGTVEKSNRKKTEDEWEDMEEEVEDEEARSGAEFVAEESGSEEEAEGLMKAGSLQSSTLHSN